MTSGRILTASIPNAVFRAQVEFTHPAQAVRHSWLERGRTAWRWILAYGQASGFVV